MSFERGRSCSATRIATRSSRASDTSASRREGRRRCRRARPRGPGTRRARCGPDGSAGRGDAWPREASERHRRRVAGSDGAVASEAARPVAVLLEVRAAPHPRRSQLGDRPREVRALGPVAEEVLRAGREDGSRLLRADESLVVVHPAHVPHDTDGIEGDPCGMRPWHRPAIARVLGGARGWRRGAAGS